MNLKSILFSAALVIMGQVASAETIALRNSTILTADTQARIENGTILIENSRIVAVGQNVSIPSDARIVDLSGMTVTPGFVVTDTLLGIVEISGGANAAETSSQSSDISAGYDVQHSINPLSTAIPVARKGGVSHAVVMPYPGANGSTFAGQAAILALNGNLEGDILAPVGMVWDMRTKEYGRGATFTQLQADLDDVRKYVRDASSLQKGKLLSRDWSRADLDALSPVVKGDMPLTVRVDRASDILTLLNLAKAQKIRLVIVGASEGWLVAKQIAEAGVPVAVDPSDNLPGSFDAVGAMSDNVARLHQAGVRLIIRGGSSAHDAGKLRYFAGMSVAKGVPGDAALKAVTSTPAEVWGDGTFGMIKAGMLADIAVWTGDPFEPMTDLSALYIGGVEQSLDSRQDALARKYIPFASK
ncbi:amidohydrolase family protein [Hyphomonas pacifica]|uniref:Amidohydrolase-related domain-containing protein n=1 Tax=Hyphomonas pacifica TaxID=1280941 RepID=A0A062U2F2_9PROT|nr:hypothetical protein [Hyphomonas pacifica]KCZ50789.1 hypothetical protein HY2_02740 [Hyphomonas pacifica]RAN34494.1 hypothetical protein HY3_11010 [Hyphomonas pacifica]